MFCDHHAAQYGYRLLRPTDYTLRVNILAHSPARPIWPVGSSKPDSDIGIVHLRHIDVGRDFSYSGIKSPAGGNHQGFERPVSQSTFFNWEIAV